MVVRKVHLTTNAIIKNTDRNGNKLRTKAGYEYEKAAIKCDEFKDKWLTTFVNKYNKREIQDWKQGDEIFIDVEQKGEFLNFKTLREVDKLRIRLERIEKSLGITDPENLEDPADIKADLPENTNTPDSSQFQEDPLPEENQVNVEDIPF